MNDQNKICERCKAKNSITIDRKLDNLFDLKASKINSIIFPFSNKFFIEGPFFNKKDDIINE